MMYSSILETIGNTPLVKLNKLAPDGVNVWVKVEAFNPMGSVKDRMALAMVEDAEARGTLQPGQTIVEATSGNTGIGLAMVCAQKGYPLVVTMAESFSVERRRLLRFLGAKVVLTPAAEKGTGMMKKAEELAETHGWFLTRQFENRANSDVHYWSTAQEILEDFGDEQIHSWVSGFGTGGTLLGVSRAMREASPETRIVAAEPDNSPILGKGIPQPRDSQGKPQGSHPHFRPHLMQGWSPDFVSDLTQAAIDDGMIDEVVPVNGDQAMALSQALARQEGIFVGTSSGATLVAALEVAKNAPQGANIVAMLPDTGERYLSTPLFADINEDMNDDEIAISTSTPGYRFDVQAPATPAAMPIEVDADAARFIDDVVAAEPVVMFALEWCEFCWTLRKLFDALGVAYKSVDIDSVEYQDNERGVKIRQALGERVGAPTMPQVFVGGDHMGGCTEIIDAFESGDLLKRFEQLDIKYDETESLDAWSLLPQWLHPRRSA
ncbi:MAG: cysteine synthase A [Gammaproteobacteria bacterium]|nr:cysteine synthase A [Gammaproteobacteria bacterium]